MIKANSVVLLCTLLALGCSDGLKIVDLTDGGSGSCTSCPKPPDLAPRPARCKADKNLPSVPMACVDFSAGLSLSDPSLKNWSFGSCWQTPLLNGYLAVADFPNFTGTCQFTTPAFSAPKGMILSVVQVIDLDDKLNNQQAQVYVNDPTGPLLLQASGSIAHEQIIFPVDPQNLPLPMNSFAFKLSGTKSVGMSRGGWQIESIAVAPVP